MMTSNLQSQAPVQKSRPRDVQNFFHFDADNVGDQMSGPANYFSALGATKRNFSSLDQLSKRLLLGGGLIFDQMSRLSAATLHSSQNHTLICWGAGIPPRGNRDQEVHEIAKRFSLFGTRNFDWSDTFDFVPCVSCMSSAFDNAPTPTHEVIVFAHQKKTPDLVAPEGIPLKTNVGQSIREVVEFIASGQTVVTSSYHGVYWAQLLGRKVVCIPFSNKFDTFEHKPFFSKSKNWMHELDGATATVPLLQNYRLINEAFSERVMHSLGIGQEVEQ